MSVANRRGSTNSASRTVSLSYCSVNQWTVVIATQEGHMASCQDVLGIQFREEGRKASLK